MIRAFAVLVGREIRLLAGRDSDLPAVLTVFVLIAVLVPLGIGPDAPLLRAIAPGMIWVAALLAGLLAIDRLWRPDMTDGALEQLALGPLPFPALVLAKATGHWLASSAPLVIAAPLLALLMGLPFGTWPMLIFTLALGTPVLSLVAAAAGALAMASRLGTSLVMLLVLPLMAPVLIAGSAGAPLPLLGMLIGALVTAPVAGSIAIKESLE
ncbi:MAG: heme exporter protein CcmB [Pseudomonadota bacterium]|nr:heme exporter protein CcmB [Pseudomonadota bacterium]